MSADYGRPATCPPGTSATSAISGRQVERLPVVSAGLPIMADSRKARTMAEDNPADAAENRWTVRGVGMSYRKAAADAAERADISMGAWLCRAIDRAIQAERESIDVIPMAAAGAKPRAKPDREKLLAVTERAI